MEDNPGYFFPKDTFEVYQQKNKWLYKITVQFDSITNDAIVASRQVPAYFFFYEGQTDGLYGLEQAIVQYRFLNKDSVSNTNYRGLVAKDTNDLPFLKYNNTFVYDKKGRLNKEIALMPSNCSSRKDTSILYYSSAKTRFLLSLSPLLDSLRKQKLIKHEVTLCAQDTSNPKNFYKIIAKRELQDLGIIPKTSPIHKIFAEMENKYNQMIKKQ
jgi:hypothetical protein